MNDRRLLAWVVVLVLFVGLVGAPAAPSARMLLRDDIIGDVDIGCMKVSDASQGDDDAWADGDVPPPPLEEKAFDGGRGCDGVQPTDGDLAAPLLPLGILFRILFARLFVL
jgi:hypothetical protein